MRRRGLLVGLWTLASGSGAVVSSAVLSDTVTPAGDFRVIATENLDAAAGDAFNTDGTVNQSNPTADQYVEYDSNDTFYDGSGGLSDISRSEIPVATVNERQTNLNGDVDIQAAISISNDTDTPIFEDILQVENPTNSPQSVGIMYDREGGQIGDSGAGQYGSDVTLRTDPRNGLTQHDVQSIFRLQIGSTRISPDHTTDSDDPDNYVSISANTTRQIDLQIDLTPYDSGGYTDIDPKAHVREAADTEAGFGDTIDTVDMLDRVTLGVDGS
jgi:hypothetical protein